MSPMLLASKLLCVFLILAAFSSTANARWLWVKGEPLPAECQTAQKLFEEQLITRLYELMGEPISFDGQLLSCNDDQCAQARLATAGGNMALFQKAVCIKGRINYELRLSHQDEAPLVYRSSFDSQATQAQLNEAGIKLADRIMNGPRFKETQKQEQTNWYIGLSTGSYTPNVAKFDGVGLQLQFDVFQKLSNRQFEIRYGLGLKTAEGKSLFRDIVQADLALTYLSSLRGLSSWFSLGFSAISVFYQDRIEYSKASFNNQDFFLESQELLEAESYNDLRLWLETGLIYTSGRLQPHLSLRLSPLSMSDGLSAELSTLFGLRW